ncbi:MAG: selenide, water dikinase SelD [Gemmatimonadetes bacterium]|jgi:selenide, water dikinase|nr:selenide, water dikinase SelD [Gemmatimonadota bacterium]
MSELTQVLRHVLPVEDPNALVGLTTGDDAAVYRLTDDRALVVTADFFTPIVDDPYDFGRIAATNALSDIYAMGAKPMFVLNLVGFPRALLPDGILEEILRGGSDVTRALGIPTLGGHSIDDAEPKYGLVAIGEVNPARMVTNAGAKPGDLLVLTKPIGSGVIATAIKKGEASDEVIAAAVEVMATLNAGAAEAMVGAAVVAGTDVTGFGLLGHLRSMMRASGTAATLRAHDVPLIDGARALAEAGHIPGGSKRNREDLAADVDFADSVDEVTRMLLADAQTSGGLLMCVQPEMLAVLIAGLDGRSPVTAVIGEVTEGLPGRIRVEG